MANQIITRMPPSPTGLFHIGSARTALYNYLYAKQNNGKFILRIEDTDKERSKKEFEDNIIASLKWLKLPYDGEVSRQSERTEIYKKYLKILIDKGMAYISKEEPKEEGERAEVIRFKNPNKKIKFNDLVLGEIEFDTTDLKDFVIAKDLDTPLYHLAVVVDDMEMGVTHVIRGQDHISNTPRQILIGEALEASRQKYAHVPLILGSDKSKLSKRHGALSVLEYREMGYLPEAILNFLALIGWNPGTEKEIFTPDELVSEFSLDKVQKSPGVFNPEKLDWINKEHMKKLSGDEIRENIFSHLPEKLQNEKLIPLIYERISKWSDVESMIGAGELDWVLGVPEFPKEKLIYKSSSPEEISKNLEKARDALEKLDEENFTLESIKESIMNITESLTTRGELLHPLRFALSGRDKSPDPFTIAYVLGKNETISRIQNTI